ncbi:hypothetical protein CPXG_00194 [Cyanophage P-RSM6]|uniref:hypothetical protein n=1 Tax=Cyanophage P-RSM6 TaxID=929832 RepID=UPI0002C18122|nr:hypothetical protein CPXG_00194 [Cyanophage P-RSM6]AGH56997.1 hypothetical protein CPXG_00194 [Cyanophage P-RSM6]|tara:strand:- start:189 stop:425 length:237 start_codon:yes stop_codon:yes gene_type:complete
MSGPHVENYHSSPPPEAQHRLNTLSDVIGDYLTSEDSSDKTYEDILTEVQSWIDYHKEHLEKANKLKSLLQGERILDV